MENKIKMTNEEYSNYVEKKAKKSPIFKNICLAFIVGGFICIIGQVITNISISYGIEKETRNANIYNLINFFRCFSNIIKFIF